MLGNRINTTLTAFDITKTNVATRDLSSPDPNALRAVGKAESSGFEADVTGKLTDHLRVIASYAYTNAKFSKDNNGLQGNFIANVPRNSGNVWLSQDLFAGKLSLGGGTFLRGKRQGDNENTFQLPGYATVDLYAATSLHLGNMRLIPQVNVINLLDKRYFINTNVYDAYPRLGIMPGQPRTVIGSIRWELYMCPRLSFALALSIATSLLGTFGCKGARTLRVERIINVSVPVGSLVPQLNTAGDAIVLTWLEPRSDKGYRFRAKFRRGNEWDRPVTIDDSPDITMFGADLPGIATSRDGSLLAYWERADHRALDDMYATTIQLSRSFGGGKTWTAPVALNRDSAIGEHSFVSAFSMQAGLGLVWLDAQNQTHMHTSGSGGKDATDRYLGAIGLRYAIFRPNGQQAVDGFIDPISCECCPTSAALASKGPVVAYRDRLAPQGILPKDIRYETPTIRDIALVRFENGHWTAPHRVYADNWQFSGCPDNGPAIAAEGNDVAVAWWTGAGREPHVSVAFSSDAGDSFGTPIQVSTGSAEGQVTVGLIEDGKAAVVGWLENRHTWARRVDVRGESSPAVSLGPAPHHARLPRWIPDGDGLLAMWSDQVNSQRFVRSGQITYH
jgi:hypothetical protein